MRTYELMFIVQADLEEEALAAVLERVQQVITTNGGEVVRAEQLGRRKLAYPINHRETGLYMLIHAQMERNAILELERHLRLSEDVLRHLLVRLDEIA